jgi:DNA adenine methylase
MNMNGAVPHIVQYQGSKRNLAPQILQYIPNRFNRLIEPFAGMAAITIAVSKQGRAEHYLLNDLNEPLVNILKEAINNPKQLIEDYTRVWNEQLTYQGGSVEHFYKVRNDFNNGNQCAANMLYLLARCVKGSVRYSSSGQFNQSPDKRRMGTNPKNLARNVFLISSLLKNKTDFFSVDYREVTKRARPGDVVYLDPPYQGVCSSRDSRYFSGIDYNEFVECVEDLNKRDIDFIISYDGTCGDKLYGTDLPDTLGLRKIMLNAGLSSQSLLLGKKETTIEALYLSHNIRKTITPVVQEQLLFPI